MRGRFSALTSREAKGLQEEEEACGLGHERIVTDSEKWEVTVIRGEG